MADDRPSYTALVIKAVALALREFPYANRRVCRRPWLPFGGPRLQSFSHIDIAVNVERDLPGAACATFADVLRDADQCSLAQITQWLRALATCDLDTNKQWSDFHWVVTRVPSWLARILLRLPCYFPGLWVKWRGGAVIVSSPARYGVDGVVATWTSPLGVSFGLVKKRPVVRDDAIVVCPTFNFVLNFDRRVMAGAQAARFFKRIVDILEHADTEMAATPDPVARNAAGILQ
jgi:pyruvate/2-oxoglutarate dehydrogenase complex dihydrolipoamide acyltransferase (E2) component